MLLALLGAALAAEPPSVDEPLRTGTTTSADAAIVVGNEDYASLPDVPYAARDAQVFYDWLVYTRGLPPDQAHLLVNGSHAAIRESIKSAAAEVKAGGTLWIYFAGHGTAVPTGSDGETERALVGKSAEADARTFVDFTLSLSEVEDIAVTSKAAEVVIVLDACYVNATRSGEALVAGRPMVPVYALQSRDRVTVWSGASPSEVAGAYEPARHGLFTYLLVGGLRGWADGELGAVDGAVSSDELKAWTSRSVRQVGQNSQTPELVGGPRKALTAKVPRDPLDPASLPRAGGSDLQDRLQALKREQLRLEQEAVEQARRRATERSDKVSDLRNQARRDWQSTKEVADRGGPMAEQAIRAYIGEYSTASIVMDGKSYKVSLPEVEEARARLAPKPIQRPISEVEDEPPSRADRQVERQPHPGTLDEDLDDSRRHREAPSARRPLLISGGAGLVLGGALVGLGWARERSILSGVEQGSLNEADARSLQGSTNSIYAMGYGLAGVGGLLAVVGFTQPVSATFGLNGPGLTWSMRW
jgi:hypothetical protein